MGEERLYKAKPTYYNGYTFRSRTEAKWAVLFDACKIKYQYEPEGIELSDKIGYIPDFYLSDIDTWFEVKGVMDVLDWHKVQQFQKDTGRPMVVGYGDFTFQASDNFTTKGGTFELTEDRLSMFVKCKNCGQFYFIGLDGSYNCLHCGHYDGPRTCDLISKGHTGGRLESTAEGIVYRNPFDIAKQARWDHGYMPLTV